MIYFVFNFLKYFKFSFKFILYFDWEAINLFKVTIQVTWNTFHYQILYMPIIYKYSVKIHIINKLLK